MSDTETIDPIETAAGRVAETSRRAREALTARYEHVTELARANPAATAITGLAVGYLLGRLMAR